MAFVFPSDHQLCLMQPCFPGDGWTQNHSCWKRPLKSMSPTSDQKPPCRLDCSSATVQLFLEHLQGQWWLHMPEQSILIPNNSFHEEIPANVQPELHLVQLEAMGFCQHLPGMEHSKWILCFALPIKLVLLQPMSFLISAILIPSPIPARGRWASGYMELSCWLELSHNTCCWLDCSQCKVMLFCCKSSK